MTRLPSLVAPLVAVSVVTALLAGCSSEAPEAPEPDGPDSSAAASPAPGAPAGLATKTTVRTVTGRLGPRVRDQLRDRVTATVDEWFEAAYLGGDYPRTDFDDAFSVFTPGAKVRARQDRIMMSNAAVGKTTYAVRALARRVRIDALADRGRASAVTVQFRLGLARQGETGAERRERVSGHLYLTFQPGDGWRVFGYDVQRGAI